MRRFGCDRVIMILYSFAPIQHFSSGIGAQCQASLVRSALVDFWESSSPTGSDIVYGASESIQFDAHLH